MLGICVISVCQPVGLGDSGRHFLAWTAGVIAALTVALAYVVASREGMRKATERFEFELDNGKIIQKALGHPTVEISLNEIKSILEYRDRLIIQSGEAGGIQIAVPTEVNG